MTGGREAFRSRFGEDPVAFDRTRPVAPPAVFDDIMALAQLRAGSSVVEIGPGTGQATRPLAERGLRVLALEIDERLAALARENLAGLPGARVQTSSFEEWDPAGAVFDAVVACNSFHWVDPAARLVKAASVLAPHGSLVLVSTPVVVPAGASRFWWDVQDDWEAVGAVRVDPASKHPDLVPDPAAGAARSDLFDDPVTVRHEFAMTLSAADYATNLSTQSGFKELPEAAQAELLIRVANRAEAFGGTVTVHHLAVVTVAKRRQR